jgi:hypothetical protein
MLKCPETFEKLMELVEKAPASLFRLVNVDQSWIDSMGHNVTTAEHMQKLFDVFRERDVTFKVKVIFCLKKLWETRVFENFLSHILERTSTDVRAVMDLYHMAVILSFEGKKSFFSFDTLFLIRFFLFSAESDDCACGHFPVRVNSAALGGVYARRACGSERAQHHLLVLHSHYS